MVLLAAIVADHIEEPTGVGAIITGDVEHPCRRVEPDLVSTTDFRDYLEDREGGRCYLPDARSDMDHDRTHLVDPMALQPTNMLPLAPTAVPAGEQPAATMAGSLAKLNVFRTWPVVLIWATPPGSVVVLFNCGIETKNVPVFVFHAGCSMPPVGDPALGRRDSDLVIGERWCPPGKRRVAGAVPAVVLKRFPYAGVSALLAART